LGHDIVFDTINYKYQYVYKESNDENISKALRIIEIPIQGCSKIAGLYMRAWLLYEYGCIFETRKPISNYGLILNQFLTIFAERVQL